MKRGFLLFILLAAAMVTMAACSDTEETIYAVTTVRLGDETTVDGGGVTVDQNAITITDSGTYTLTGTLENGILTVDAEGEDVTLILENASIINSAGPALLIKAAESTFISLAEGSSNYLRDGGSTDYDAPLYGCTSFSIEGSGILDIDGTVRKGITSEKELTIDGGIMNVNAADAGISAGKNGNGKVVINDATITIYAGGDGIQSNGSIEINGGSVMSSGSAEKAYRGLNASGELRINGGTLFASGAGNAMPSDSSTQKSMAINFDTEQAANTMLTIRHGSTDLFTFTPVLCFKSVLFSSPELREGESYDIYLSDSLEATVTTGSVDAMGAGEPD